MPKKLEEIGRKGKQIVKSVFSTGSSSHGDTTAPSTGAPSVTHPTRTYRLDHSESSEQSIYTGQFESEMFDPTAAPTQTSVSGPPIPACEPEWKVTDFVEALVVAYLGEDFAPHPTYKFTIRWQEVPSKIEGKNMFPGKVKNQISKPDKETSPVESPTASKRIAEAPQNAQSCTFDERSKTLLANVTKPVFSETLYYEEKEIPGQDEDEFTLPMCTPAIRLKMKLTRVATARQVLNTLGVQPDKVEHTIEVTFKRV